MRRSHHGFQQSARGDREGQTMKIGAVTAGEITDLLEITDADCRQSEIFERNGETQVLEEVQQLTVGLGCQAIASQPLLQTELNKDAETDFFTMQNVMAGLKLGQAVVHGMGSNGAAACPTQAAHHTGGECTGFGRAGPGGTVAVLHGLGAINQQLITQHPGHLHSLLNQVVTAVSTAHGGFVPLGESIRDSAGQ